MDGKSNAIERANLEAAVSQAADGVLISDAAGNIRYVNPAFTALTGYTCEEVIGKHTRLLKSGQQDEAFYEDLWKTIRRGDVWYGELSNRRKDGTIYVEEEMRITPVRNEAGIVFSYIAIKHDVTGRRAAEETQRLLAAIVENTEDAIVACCRAGTILTWNRGAELVFGYTSGEAIGTPITRLVPREEQQSLARSTDSGFRGGSIGQQEGFRTAKRRQQDQHRGDDLPDSERCRGRNSYFSDSPRHFQP